MATSLQVNGNTGQAVGAFNQLAQSINTAQGAFANLTTQVNGLNTALNKGPSAAGKYGNGFKGSIATFDHLQSSMSSVFDLMHKVAAGIELVFDSVLHQLDKLQGFNAIMSVSVKSADDVGRSYEFLRSTANNLGIDFNSLTSNYAKLVAAIPQGTNQLDIANRAFIGVAMAARTLHATNSDTQLMFYAITQMASKGVVSMEELRRQLGEKLPGVMGIAAKALNTLPGDLEAAIKKGVVVSEKFLPILGDALIRTFSDSAQKASESVSASVNRLQNVWVDFVKYLLDSGAAQSIIGVFDALREKLSDQYLITRFAELVKNLADRITEFVTNITAEDLRNGFDTFSKGLDLAIRIAQKFIEALTWIINNAGKAGAIIGGIGGAMVGSMAGPVGAVVGAATGAAAGGYFGTQMSPTDSERANRANADAAASAASAASAAAQQKLLYEQMIPTLQKFSGVNDSSKISGLLQGDKLTADSVAKLNSILTDPRFKTDKDRATAVYGLAKYGQVLSPDTAQLSDVLGPGKPKKPKVTRGDGGYQSTMLRDAGLNANFQKDWDNLSKAYAKGALSLDDLTDAQARLLAKQPFAQEAARARAQEMETDFKLTMRQIQAKEDLAKTLQDEANTAGLTSDKREVETRINDETNRFAEVGLTMTKEQTALLREKLQIIQQIRDVTAAEDEVLAATVDKYRSQINMVQGIDKGLQDPTSGLTKEMATDYLVGKDPNAQGSQQWMDAQKRSTEEYYKWVDLLRSRDLVSEETAQQMKARAAQTYEEARIKGTSDIFGTLASLSNSGNKKLAAIGRAAAIAQATMDGYAAVQKALAAGSPPLNYILAAAVGVAAAANVAKIAGISGFESGGYTGNAGRKQITGFVHGQEFVVNAAGTERNRPVLEAMNKGQRFDLSFAGSTTNRTTVDESSDRRDMRTFVDRSTPLTRSIGDSVTSISNDGSTTYFGDRSNEVNRNQSFISSLTNFASTMEGSTSFGDNSSESVRNQSQLTTEGSNTFGDRINDVSQSHVTTEGSTIYGDRIKNASQSHVTTEDSTIYGDRIKNASQSHVTTEDSTIYGDRIKNASQSHVTTEGSNIFGDRIKDVNQSYVTTEDSTIYGDRIKDVNQSYVTTEGSTIYGDRIKDVNQSYVTTEGSNTFGDRIKNASQSHVTTEGSNTFGYNIKTIQSYPTIEGSQSSVTSVRNSSFDRANSVASTIIEGGSGSYAVPVIIAGFERGGYAGAGGIRSSIGLIRLQDNRTQRFDASQENRVMGDMNEGRRIVNSFDGVGRGISTKPSIQGFQPGGHTGYVGRKEIAGWVHGQEFVVNATNTAPNLKILEAMNGGQRFTIDRSGDLLPGYESGGYVDSPRYMGTPVESSATARNLRTVEMLNDGRRSEQAKTGVPVIVNVTNNSSNSAVTKQERQTSSGYQIEVMVQDIVVKQVKQSGPIASAMEAQWGLNRAAGTTR